MGASRPVTTWKDVMGRGALLSRIVKSCCCRSPTGGPDLGVTTTSSWIFPSAAGAGALLSWALAPAAHNKSREKKTAKPYVDGHKFHSFVRSDLHCRGAPPGELRPLQHRQDAALHRSICNHLDATQGCRVRLNSNTRAVQNARQESADDLPCGASLHRHPQLPSVSAVSFAFPPSPTTIALLFTPRGCQTIKIGSALGFNVAPGLPAVAGSSARHLAFALLPTCFCVAEHTTKKTRATSPA